MAIRLFFMVFLIGVFLAAFSQLDVTAGDNTVHFCASWRAAGCMTKFSNDGSHDSMLIVGVDPGVKRLEIIDSNSKKVLFDKRPHAGRLIELPKGDFTAIGWSTYKKESSNAVEAILSEPSTNQPK